MARIQRETMTRNISLKISEDDYEWLKTMAGEEDRTIDGMVRMAIKRYRSQENKNPLHAEGTE